MDDKVFRTLKTKLTLSIVSVLAVFLFLLLFSLNFFLVEANHSSAKVTLNFIIENRGERDDRHMEPRGKRPEDQLPQRDKLPPGEMPPGEMQPPLMKPDEIIGGDKRPPEFGREEMMGKTFWERIIPLRIERRGMLDFAAILFPDKDKAPVVITSFRQDISDDEAISLAREVLEKKLSLSMNYKYYGVSTDKTNKGNLVVLLDRENAIIQEQRLAVFSTILFVLSLGLAFLIALLITNWAVRPVKLAFENQKRFIADVSHELKTPIAVIGANIDVLEEELPDNKWLSYIRQENTRMGSLVKDLLYLAKNDAGRIEYEMLPFSLSDAVEEAVSPFEKICQEEKKSLTISSSHEIVAVNGDEQKIKQVVIILVDNAIKNSSEEASISVTVGKTSSNAFVKVRNTGKGIPKEIMERIFDRFYRVDDSRSRATGGYGLGLSIAKSIADFHKGKITVESEVGKYAEFTLTLPLMSI